MLKNSLAFRSQERDACHDRAERTKHKENLVMPTPAFYGRNRITMPTRNLGETPPPLACLHCAATQAAVRTDRQILANRLGYPAQCVCCDCEIVNTCPQCSGENLGSGTYDYGIDRDTGYADSGERYHCRDCGAAGVTWTKSWRYW